MAMKKAPAAKASKKPTPAKPATPAAPQSQVAGALATGKLSALDAAAKALGEVRQALNCHQLVETMASQGYWTSPAGLTPAATLFAAISKEVATKGAAASFVNVASGQFVRDRRTVCPEAAPVAASRRCRARRPIGL
ncbi:MAG: hypothetical protein JNM56_35635 [Planctomycetia bacterium]|nr:hypothetical protein [Planctomycetia bacterium]